MSESRPRSTQTVQIDNEAVRVSESHFPPGASTGWHRHEHDYVVVPLTTAPLRVVTAAGESINQIVTGQAYFRAAGVEHEVINDNDFDVRFIETEVK